MVGAPVVLLAFGNYFIEPINISILNLIFIFGLFIVYGLVSGYILLGMKFKFRKIDAFQNLLVSNLVILSVLPLNEISSLYINIILYLSPCGGVIGYAQSLSNGELFTSTNLYTGMIVNFLIYLGLAVVSYNKFYKSARKNGTLGWY